MKTDKDLVYEVIKLSQFGANEAIFWRWNLARTQIDVFAQCGDVFLWGCADVEQITWDNLDVLKQAVKDIEEASGSEYDNQDDAFYLFCARVRGMRPQGAMYKYLKSYDTDEDRAREKTEKIRALFDAAGPPREVGVGNPVDRDEVE